MIREALGDEADQVMTELTLVDQQVTRIQAIVGKLLKFARPSEFSESEEMVSLRPVVDDCLVLVEHVLSKGNIQVNTRMEPVPVVRIDPGEMQQVVINLIVNAVHAMGGAGRLELTLRPETRDGRSGACLIVHDSGPGISPDKLDAVFDPFFTTKQGEGTGLGLSISQTLIQQAGGLISVHNPATGGAEFNVWLPSAELGDVAAQ